MNSRILVCVADNNKDADLAELYLSVGNKNRRAEYLPVVELWIPASCACIMLSKKHLSKDSITPTAAEAHAPTCFCPHLAFICTMNLNFRLAVTPLLSEEWSHQGKSSCPGYINH